MHCEQLATFHKTEIIDMNAEDWVYQLIGRHDGFC